MNRGSAIALGLAASAAITVPRRASGAQALRLATIPIDSGAEMIFADARGTFKARQLATEIQYIINGSAIVSTVLGGAIDIGYTNIITLALAHARGIPLTIVAPAGLYNSKAPTSALVVLNGSPIKTARDCNGKTFGVSSLKSITQYSTQAWLDKNGGDSKSVRFIELSFPEIAPALAQGRVDIGHFAEPFVSDAKKIGRVLGDSYDAVGSNFLISAYVSTTAYATANPDVVKRFADAIRETAVWANSHHAESGVMLASAAKLDAATIGTMVRSTYADRLTADMLQPSIDVTAKYAGLEAFPASQLISS